MQPAPHCGKPIWLPRGKGGRGEGRGTAGGQSRPREGSRTCRAAGHSVRRGAGPVRMDARGPRTQRAGRCRERELAAWSEAGHARARAALRTEAAD